MRVKKAVANLKLRRFTCFAPPPASLCGQAYWQGAPHNTPSTAQMHGTPSTGTPRGTPSGRGRSPRTPGHSSHSPTNSGVAQGTMAPTTSFFSCLSIPVEGAIPIDDDTSGKTPVEMPLATESKRAPRKSKMDAMAAMSASARSRSVDLDEMAANGPLAEKYYNRPPIPISPTLDLNSVKTAGQGVPAPTAHPTPRPFGLQDCPEYHPTAEQFQDPMAYIQSIAEEAKQFGICKVVPPPDWKMPFVTDTEARGHQFTYLIWH